MLLPVVRMIFFVSAASTLILSLTILAQESQEEKKQEKLTTNVIIEVVGVDEESKNYIKGAKVYIKSAEEDEDFEMTVKTNEEGRVKVPDVPQGRVLIQITVEEWETYGEWFELKATERTIKVTLKKKRKTK